MKNQGRILLLLDDPAELAGSAPLAAGLPPGWQLIPCARPADALFQLNQVPFDVVMVDLQGNPLRGVEFLQQVWAVQPPTLRFLLGDSLAPDLMVACALGSHHFLHKPLDPAELRQAIERAGLVESLLAQGEARALVARLRTFPARPSVYFEVLNELRSPRASAAIVGELVARDLAISSKLIQIANSAFFAFEQPVHTLTDAVFMLGLESTASLVLGLEAFSRLDHVQLPCLSTDQIWRHSQTVANAARAIASFMTNQPGLAHEAYTAALLHDLGKLALAANLESPYRQTLEVAQARGIPLWQAERTVFGADHAQAGAYLLALWGLPEGVLRAVGHHHLPSAQMPGKFGADTALHLANFLEHAEAMVQAGAPFPESELNYPEELRIHEHLDTLRRIVRTAVRPTPGITEFIRKNSAEAAAAAQSRAVPQMPLEVQNHGWWSRLRSLLAT